MISITFISDKNETMGETVLLTIIIIAGIYIFTSLNSRIKKLENEVRELSARLGKTSQPDVDIRKQDIIIETPKAAEHEILTAPESQEINTETFPSLPKKDWTVPVFDFLKQNLLTILGIFTLVLGIGYFVKYAIDKNWIGETARTLIGLGAGAGIMLTGHLLRKNYAVFASIITGGGIAVLYFTTTIAFREYHLVPPNTAFLITSLITLLSILLSYRYNSEILIIFSIIGGFSAPLMISTGQSNYPFLFTYLSLLNAGMLAVVFLKHWKSVGWTAYIFTSLYLFYWTADHPEILNILFYMISYIIFYIFALQEYLKKNTLAVSGILMLVLINFSSLTGLIYIFNELHYEPAIIFPVIFAVLNSILLLREYGKRSFGTAYSVFAGITISLITLAVAIQFKAHLITSVWAIEATLLLFIWKKTGHRIFKTCFYILFPLVITAQVITWSAYFNNKAMNIVFNPVFLTSLVTTASTIINLFLLKNISHDNRQPRSFFENIFVLTSYGIIYITLLLEITYHMSGRPWSAITSTGLLYSIYYIFALLLFRKKLDIDQNIQTGLIYLFLFLLSVHASFSVSAVVTAVLLKKLAYGFYMIHFLHWIPFIYIYRNAAPETGFYKTKLSYWLISTALVIAVSCGIYHTYILGTVRDISFLYTAKEHFSMLYLPIIWTILACVFIYTGLKRNSSEYSKIGFTLIGIMILKLYGHDVWEMDNVSRIVAFIILGVLLLLGSFTFQRLKKIIKNMVDKKDDDAKE
ncbi:DUF2339 domain-containing protein [Chryseobacterium indologenes]|nr:DUF2339 domain-containing protein [Chryseobacterium indologenes]